MIKKLLAWYRLRNVHKIYNKNDYLEAYSKHTDIRVDWDHKLAIGGDWESIGSLQFKFLVDQGLSPEHSFLDIGMGTLRGGRHFINYLNAGNYTGFDISPKVVSFSKSFVKELNLDNKNPNLLLNESKRLDFDFLNGQHDYILAQSVFSHLLKEHVSECFENLSKIMHSNSKFYFTILQSNKFEIKAHKDVFYPISFFHELSAKNGFNLIDISNQYDHPKGQKMLLATVKK